MNRGLPIMGDDLMDDHDTAEYTEEDGQMTNYALRQEI